MQFLERTVNSFLIYTPVYETGTGGSPRGYGGQLRGTGSPGGNTVVEDLAHEGVELVPDQLLPLQQLVADPLDGEAARQLALSSGGNGQGGAVFLFPYAQGVPGSGQTAAGLSVGDSGAPTLRMDTATTTSRSTSSTRTAPIS